MTVGHADSDIELSIVMPCLNEAETLESCVAQAHAFLAEAQVVGEVVVADNGSTDGSPDIATAAGARVVHVATKGYGAALLGGISAARGRFVAMGDADDSYDFGSLMPFLERLRAGDSLVMGNRFRGGIDKGAMPWLHRYVGNPLLSMLGRMLFRVRVGDFHCGLRAFDRKALLGLQLRTTGMEFASEIVVKSALEGLQIGEVPTRLRRDGRSRPPHLRSFRDGWRHLRFLLLFSPRWLLLYPGALATIGGLALTALLTRGSIAVASVHFDVGSLLYAIALTILGYQTLVFAALSRVYAQTEGFLPSRTSVDSFARMMSIEKGLIAGVALFTFGIVASVASLLRWRAASFGDLDPAQTIRTIAPAMVGLVLGMQTILGGIFLSILRIRRTS